MRDDTPFQSEEKFIRRLLGIDNKLCEEVDINEYISAKWPWPEQLEVSPTDECNLKCSWCVSGELTHQAREKRKTLDSQVLMDFLSDFREKRGKAVTFTGGGEPTCHPDIYEILYMTHRLGLQIGIFTNGIYPEPLVDVLQKCQWVRFSIDFGPSGCHKKNTTSEEFKQLLKNVDNLRFIGPHPRVGMCANIGHLHEQKDIDELLDLAPMFDYLQFRVLLPTKYSDDFQLAPVWEYILWKRRLNKLPKNVKFSDDRLKELRARRFYNWKVCTGHHFIPFLHADGNLQVCAYHPNNPYLHFGNIYSNTYEEIWKGMKRQRAIECVSKLDYKAVCQPCCKLTAVNEKVEQLFTPKEDENFA